MPPDTSNHILLGLTSRFDLIYIVFGGLVFVASNLIKKGYI